MLPIVQKCLSDAVICVQFFTGIHVARPGSLDLLLRTNPSAIAIADTTVSVCTWRPGDADVLRVYGQGRSDTLDEGILNGFLLYPILLKNKHWQREKIEHARAQARIQPKT